MENLKQKTLTGFIFKFGERGASLAVSFIVQIILARILMPEEFGIIALLTVFMTILDVFATYGFGNSLIVNKNSDDIDFSTCFYWGVGTSLLIYAIVYITSSQISLFFYNREDLDILVKVMALRLPVAAINSVQFAYIAKNMQFKLLFYSSLLGTIFSGVISITMAYMGFGIWALVTQYLSNIILNTIILWILSQWRPKLYFSLSRLKAIYDYGWKILAVGLIDTIYGQISNLVVAKKYSTSDLAYFNRGGVFPGTITNLIEPTLDTVLFPALSNCNDDHKTMKEVTKRVTNVSTYIICGMMFMLAAMSKPLVAVLLTEKWLPCVVYLQIACVSGIFRPLQVINNCVIRANGNSGMLLWINIIKKGIGILLLIFSMSYGVKAIAASLVVTNLIATLINIYPNRRILCYGYREQFGDLLNNLSIPLIIGLILWFVSLLPISYSLMLVLQLALGLGMFWLLSSLFHVDSYQYIMKLIYNYIPRK